MMKATTTCRTASADTGDVRARDQDEAASAAVLEKIVAEPVWTNREPHETTVRTQSRTPPRKRARTQTLQLPLVREQRQTVGHSE